MQGKTQIKSIGIDLGKTTFHLVALGIRSQVVVRKKFSRQQLLTYTAKRQSSAESRVAPEVFLYRICPPAR